MAVGSMRTLFASAGLAFALVVPATASAHLERPAYWPDPAADTAVSPPAGGGVPKVRSLASALSKDRKRLHVVCKPGSLQAAFAAIGKGRRDGYVIRPSQAPISVSKRQGQRLRTLNRQLFKRCRHRHIQSAVAAAGNNGRVVVMPGTYLEEPSRAKAKNDPACDRYENPDGSVSFRYHVACPNDANLVYVQGREASGDPPHPARADRHGIPDAGRCLRCNLQIEGSGVSPDDVRLEAAADPSTPLRKAPKEYAKDVGLRVDRADGAVVRNITVAHAGEHGIYITETDGYLIERVRLFWSHAYGMLMFTSDHGLVQDSDASGSGDSSIYPGATPDTGAHTVEAEPRINTVIRRNDMHHSAIGCSCAAMGNAMLVEENHAYDNGTGISTDSIGPAEHPGYPQDGSIYRNNQVYSNNFNTFAPDTDVPPAFFTVVGVGMAIWGGNANRVESNRIYDNWRYGTMLLVMPDALLGPDALPDGRIPKTVNSTGYDNRYSRNIMGIAPGGALKPNGTDFWWDSFPGTTGNRWCNNIGANGRLTSDPEVLPGCEGPSVAIADVDNLAEYTVCGVLFLAGRTGDPRCAWWQTPTRPGTRDTRAASARADTSTWDAALGSAALPAFTAFVDGACTLRGVDTLACAPARYRLGAPSGVRAASCGDWVTATPRARRTIIRTLRTTLLQELPAGAPRQTLADGDAALLFDGACSRPRSQWLYLWGIYMQAAAFRDFDAAMRRAAD